MNGKKSRRDDSILDWTFAITLIPKGWHDLTRIYNTPSGFINLAAVAIIISPLRGLAGR